MARARQRWLLMVIPAIWCLITGGFLLAMKAPDAWIAPLAAVLTAAFASRRHRSV